VKQGQTGWRPASEQIGSGATQDELLRASSRNWNSLAGPLEFLTSHARLHSMRTRSRLFFALLARLIQRRLRHR